MKNPQQNSSTLNSAIYKKDSILRLNVIYPPPQKKTLCCRNVSIYIEVHWQRDWRKISGHKEYLLKGKIHKCVKESQ